MIHDMSVSVSPSFNSVLALLLAREHTENIRTDQRTWQFFFLRISLLLLDFGWLASALSFPKKLSLIFKEN